TTCEHFGNRALVDICRARSRARLFAHDGIRGLDVLGQAEILLQFLDGKRDDKAGIVRRLKIFISRAKIPYQEAANHSPDGALAVVAFAVGVDPKMVQTRQAVEVSDRKLHGL